MTGDATAEARALLESSGFVVLREKSYRQAQERQRVAEALKDYAEKLRAETQQWAYAQCDEQRRLRDRLSFVYDVARAHGATVDDLRGES